MNRQHKELLRLQLFITLVNDLNRDLIFVWKQLSLGVCIITGYAAISQFEKHAIFGVMYCILFLDVTLFYTVIYDRAFKVPELFVVAKSSLSLMANKLGNPVQRKVTMRKIKSIPPVGIKVGEFHMLERTSTPIFLNYVLTNVVNMLVAFQ